MRKRFRVLLFAALAAAFIVPVGFALSLESSSSQTARLKPLPVPAAAVVTTASAAVTSSVIVADAVDRSPATTMSTVPDAAKLLLIGTMLFGLAAAVRKAI